MREKFIYYNIKHNYLLLLNKEWHLLFNYSELKSDYEFIGNL